jgi:hypothetical protein
VFKLNDVRINLLQRKKLILGGLRSFHALILTRFTIYL